ncbi:MAG: hypothetical protein GY750_17055 [Lentisphaerae bacterium]|nr:hypothetical protein [Lentisphaerota bacterium]
MVKYDERAGTPALGINLDCRDRRKIVDKLIQAATLVILVIIVLLVGITFVGLLPLIVFEDSINDAISKLSRKIAE